MADPLDTGSVKELTRWCDQAAIRRRLEVGMGVRYLKIGGTRQSFVEEGQVLNAVEQRKRSRPRNRPLVPTLTRP